MSVKKLSTQQDYREAPVGTVAKYDLKPSSTLLAFIKINHDLWLSTASSETLNNFKMSGDIREIVTVIEVK